MSCDQAGDVRAARAQPMPDRMSVRRVHVNRSNVLECG